jgi:HEAT repeat protein
MLVMNRRLAPLLTSLTLAASLVLLGACASGPAELSAAQKLLESKLTEDPQFQNYALSIMADSDAPHARSARLAAIAGGARASTSAAIPSLDPQNAEELAALEGLFAGRGVLKMQAAARLAESGNAVALEWLASQMGKGGTVLPATAMNALAATDRGEAVQQALRGMIWSKDLSTRNEGYEILGQVEQPWAVDLLLEGLDKEFAEDRVGPIAALGAHGDLRAVQPVLKWIQTQGLVEASLDTLGRLGDSSAVAKITPLLENEQPVVRVFAASALWRLGEGEPAKATLGALIDSEEGNVRQAVASELAKIADPQASSWLAQLATDADAEVRTEALRALVAAPASTDGALLAQAANDESAEVATLALGGLAEVGSAEQAAALSPLLKSPNPYVAISAAHTILSIHGGKE